MKSFTVCSPFSDLKQKPLEHKSGSDLVDDRDTSVRLVNCRSSEIKKLGILLGSLKRRSQQYFSFLLILVLNILKKLLRIKLRLKDS